MPSGSCLCGKVKYSFTGAPAAKGACHCLPCRKTSGTSNSLNIMVPEDKFKTEQGEYKKFTRKGDSGKDVTYNFCADCPTVLFVEAEALPGLKLIKMGSIDESDRAFLDSANMDSEIYTRNRFAWCQALQGVEQKEGPP